VTIPGPPSPWQDATASTKACTIALLGVLQEEWTGMSQRMPDAELQVFRSLRLRCGWKSPILILHRWRDVIYA
jgi:hypothetical protein